MYAQFIYYIIVILIISGYQGQSPTNFSFPVSALLLFLIFSGFAALTRSQFRKVSRFSDTQPLSFLDHKFNRIVTRQIVIAILLLVLMLYGLNLPDFLFSVPLFSSIPTLRVIICVGLFVGLMAIIWKYSYTLYCKIYRNDLSFLSYAKSNIAFALPVILPWVILSVIYDIILLIPHKPISNFFLTGFGEVIFYLFSIGFMLLFLPSLIQRLWGCKSLEPGYERHHIESLCKRAGLEFSDILYWPLYGGKMITAGIMGFVKSSRYIFVTPALLRMLSLDEIDTVIAHEIGHAKKMHMYFYILILAGYLLLHSVFMEIIDFFLVFLGVAPKVYFALQNEPSTGSAFLFVILMAGSFILYFRFVFGYFMRNFERQADTYVFQLFDSADPLIRTFEKITLTSGIPADKPNWHHFSIKDRIAFLRRCEADKTLITRHEKKIKNSLLLFLGILLFAAIIGYAVIQSGFSQNIRQQATVDYILEAIDTEPENPELYGILGDLYLEFKTYEGAVSAYKKALSLNAKDPHVLNNLAWLYATSTIPTIQNPEEALELAQKAATLSPTPEILDTLAQSLYINGKIEAAIGAEIKAIALIRKNPALYENQRDHYETQLRKFKQAGEKSKAKNTEAGSQKLEQ